MAAAAVMAFDYGGRRMWLDDAVAAPLPGAGYLLCARHAESAAPPIGWTFWDRRRAAAMAPGAG